jgi:hypothetical protein
MTRWDKSVQWVRMIRDQPPITLITYIPSDALYSHPALPGHQVVVQSILASAPGLYTTNALDIEMQSFRHVQQRLPVVKPPYSTMQQSNTVECFLVKTCLQIPCNTLHILSSSMLLRNARYVLVSIFRVFCINTTYELIIMRVVLVAVQTHSRGSEAMHVVTCIV